MVFGIRILYVEIPCTQATSSHAGFLDHHTSTQAELNEDATTQAA